MARGNVTTPMGRHAAPCPPAFLARKYLGAAARTPSACDVEGQDGSDEMAKTWGMLASIILTRNGQRCTYPVDLCRSPVVASRVLAAAGAARARILRLGDDAAVATRRQPAIGWEENTPGPRSPRISMDNNRSELSQPFSSLGKPAAV